MTLLSGQCLADAEIALQQAGGAGLYDKER